MIKAKVIINVLIIQLIPLFLFSQSVDENPGIKISATAIFNHALIYNGHVQVREHAYKGTLLNFKQDLGMESWLKPVGALSINFYNKNIFEFSYGESFFQGTKVLEKETWYNGTLFKANSKADIQRTIFKSYEWVWKARLLHTEKHNFYLRTAILYEKLKFYVDADIAKNSPISETFEKFWKQQQPLPTFGVASVYRISKPFSLKSEIGFTYLPKVKTWMNEGGRISMSQSNIDASCSMEYRYKFLAINAGLWFKHFRLFQESTEDTNLFLINGGGYRVALSLVF